MNTLIQSVMGTKVSHSSLFDTPTTRLGETKRHGDRGSSPSEGNTSSAGSPMQDIFYLNSLNQTVVAAWDLQDPDPNNPSKRSRQRHTEKLGMGRDRRNKVPRAHFLPGGKYRGMPCFLKGGFGCLLTMGPQTAICKLFMGFSGSKGFEYMGTGWLITKDTVVTAGHCLYDSNGGYLRSVKVYIGYQGPEDTALDRNSCEMRLGKVATIPAEYIKTAHTVHDVGFVLVSDQKLTATAAQIKLQSPFIDVEPFQPENTPKSSPGMKLGVVGYPGDIEGGNDMYEHWDMTKFDLAESRYLSYQIDTEVGESGSPILREIQGSNRLSPIGVHTDGGYPNSGSVIGPLGNLFSDYTTAIRVKQTEKLTPNTVRMPVPRVAGARNLEYISIPAPARSTVQVDPYDGPVIKRPGKESASRTSQTWLDRLDERPSPSPKHREAAKVIADLEGSGGKEPSPGSDRVTEAAALARGLENGFTVGSRKKKEYGTNTTAGRGAFIKSLITVIREEGGLFLPYGPERTENQWHYSQDMNYLPPGQDNTTANRTVEMSTRLPQNLPATEYKESGAISGETQEELIQQVNTRMESEQGLQTKFFLNFPPKLEGNAKEELKKSMRYVQEWQCWAYGLAALKAQQQVKAGKLTSAATPEGAAKRSTYENMVYDHLMRQSPWISKTYDEVQNRQISCTKADLHTTLIKAAVEGFTVPGKLMKSLHDVLESISKGIISFSMESKSQEVQYFIMFTKYDYEQFSETVQTSIRVISFKTDVSVNEFNLNKNTVSRVELAFSYHQYQCDFNSDLYAEIKGDLSLKVVDAGRQFSGLKVEDIDLDLDSASHESMPLPLRSVGKQSAFVRDNAASYDKIVDNLTELSKLGQGSSDSAAAIADILEAQSVDVGVAALIGTRLAVQGHQLLKENTAIPTSLRFYDAGQDLRNELQTLTEEKETVEQHNKSLQYALDEARLKAEHQAKDIESLNETVKVLRRLVPEVEITDQLKSAQAKVQDLYSENERLKKENADAVRDLQASKDESRIRNETALSGLQAQISALKGRCEEAEKQKKTALESEEATKALLQNAEQGEERLAVRVKSLRNRIKGFDPGLSYRDSGDLELDPESDSKSSDTSAFSHPVAFDVEMVERPEILVGISDLKPDGKAFGFQVLAQHAEKTGFTIEHGRDGPMTKLKANWLALSDFGADIHVQEFQVPSPLPTQASTKFDLPFSKPVSEGYEFCSWLKSFKVGSTDLTDIQLELDVKKDENGQVQSIFSWSLQCFDSLTYECFAYKPNGMKQIQIGYIDDGEEGATSHEWVEKFDRGEPFTRIPRVFIALSSFGPGKVDTFWFESEVTNVSKDEMTVVTRMDRGDRGPCFIRYLWIAVQ
ncbi:hypothetical protein BO94DRAFT_599305 [Aspergillus sclerotioniger CBS 115572]|uniref:Serine protease n=1 Tax=Aspergillus sclerotioniger CBS 115572 TaxID=1450535 RepID=A0A317WI18_9EURO|nr:hypothetical protein BO94DRAFT_599305 [Aspergillus sclerotioniger CBS 115572]PWY83850.1 hypothetical protein BO94DRAFT_599305 [Aspergillus sclerotioniger CBS 115572]